MTAERILIVGGTGLIGRDAARHLSGLGYDVTVGSRSEPATDRGLEPLPFPRVEVNYLDPSPQSLREFDTVVFAAGSDIRHIGKDDDDAATWERVQSEGVPAFAKVARDAGVRRFVQIGSYYHQVVPQLAAESPYVEGRRRADEGARALTTADFAAITLNPPSIVGSMAGPIERRYGRIVDWARGVVDEPPRFAPTGGTNYMSLDSVSQAIAGAISAGEPGHAYLIGDENLTYQQYFQLFADAAGAGLSIEERDEELSFQPDRFIVQGRGRVIEYEPDPAEVALLGYARSDVRRAVEAIVAAVDATRASA